MNTPKPTKNCTVYISNLSYERDRNGLKSMFSRFGIIKNIKIVVEPSTNQSRGMAFVEMATVEQATKAIEALNQKVFDGRTVKANWAVPMRSGSVAKESKKKIEKDLEFKSVQIAKKAKNEAKRKANPLTFKLPTKKK